VIARLTVSWFVLTGGWEADFSDERANLIAVRMASWIWPPQLWRVEGRIPPTTTAVLLELQGLGLVKLGERMGGSIPVQVLKLYGLPDRILAELDALIAKRHAGSAGASEDAE